MNGPPRATGPIRKAVCLFALFAADGRLSHSVLHYLGALRACDLSVHVALSGMTGPHPQDRERLDRLGIVAHPRPNEGLDFGAWQFLLRTGCAKDADLIVLANDSVFGPVRDLRPILRDMLSRDLDIWGMVESHEVAWHLQSWFIAMRAETLQRPAIMRVLELPFASMSKAEIVLHGEIGLGCAIRAEGLSWAACLPDERRGLRRLIATNPMHLDWLHVLRSGRVPFIKVELLRDNPMRIPWQPSWPRALRRYGSFPRDWITERITPSRGVRASLKMRLLYLALTRSRLAALRTLFGREG